MKRPAIIVILALIFLAGIVVGQEDFQLVSSTLNHNPYYSIGKVGEYVYCGGYNGIHIFEISDPANPNLIKICDFPEINNILFDASFAYLISRNHPADVPGLRVLDISDPLNPEIVGNFDYSFYSSYEQSHSPCLLYDDAIYVARERLDSNWVRLGELVVFDLSDPYNPQLSDVFQLPQTYFTGLWVSDNYLHVTTTEYDFWDNYWTIFSLDDPDHPELVANLYFGENFVGGVAAYGNYAYLDINGRIHIYDFTDPYYPEIVRIDSSGMFNDLLYANNDIGYKREGIGDNDFLISLDLSDPVYPIEMGSLRIQDGFNRFAYGGDTCFTASTGLGDGASKFNIIDFTDLYNPTVIGEHWTAGRSYDVQLAGDIAYVANGASGLTLVDISVPEEPIVMGSIEPYNVRDILIRDDRAYILAGFEYFAYFGIFDISDPRQPVLLGDYSDYSGRGRNVFVDGDYAFITKVPEHDPSASFVSIIDVSDPTAPTPAYSIGNLNSPRYVIVEGNYVYVTCLNDLKIYNVANLDSITLMGSYMYRNTAYQIAVELPYAYMACPYSKGLEIINVSDPAAPYFVSEYDSVWANNITLFDNYAVLKGRGKLHLMDISDPEAPLLVSSYSPTAGWDAEEVFVRGNYIYDAAYNEFQILRLTPTGIKEIGSVDLTLLALSAAYPNPFNASTTISYDLPSDSEVRIEIYDLLGRKIETLLTGIQQAGSHSVVWEAEDVSSGVYFYRIKAGEYAETRKCVLLK